jgi:deoxyribose-phosphate aldolase
VTIALEDVPVDAVGVARRVAVLGTRSIKTSAKDAGLRLALSMVDLTTLEGKDTPGKVERLCAKAVRPDPGDPSLPHVAAVCVYPSLVAAARAALGSAPVLVASVATGFPAGQTPLETRLGEVRAAVAAGADEIDMVIDRGAFLSGRHSEVADQIAATLEACGPAHLKVILETGELVTYDNVRRASLLAMRSGAHFIKTSTGKMAPAATPAVILVMLEAIRDYVEETGRQVGMKPAGGIRTAKQALQTLVLVKETLGEAWLDPDWFRFGASSLVNELLMQLQKLRSGTYPSPDAFSVS